MKIAWSVRLAREADVPGLEKLIPLSVRALQARYYSTAQMDGALGSVFGVDRQLIRDGTYFVIEHDNDLIGCGGWSKRKTLFGSDHETGRDDAELNPICDAARIRAFFIHPEWARRGLGHAILDTCEKAIRHAAFVQSNWPQHCRANRFTPPSIIRRSNATTFRSQMAWDCQLCA